MAASKSLPTETEADRADSTYGVLRGMLNENTPESIMQRSDILQRD